MCTEVLHKHFYLKIYRQEKLYAGTKKLIKKLIRGNATKTQDLRGQKPSYWKGFDITT